MSLPKGWVSAELGQLSTKIGSGATPRGGKATYGQTGIPLIRSMNVHFGEFKREGLAHLDEGQAQALQNVTVGEHDVLLNITGASIGRVCLAPSDMSGARVNQHVCIIRTVGEVLPAFVERFLAAPEMQRKILEENYGFTRQALTKEMIEKFLVPVPPVAEQRRIVAKLEVLTARLARAQTELDRLLDLASKVRLGALRSVFQFGSEEMPAGWSRKRIDQIAEVQLGRQRSPKDHEGPHMRPYLRAANVTWSGWDLTDVKEMNFTPAEFDTFCLKEGDILLNEGSGSAKEVGKPAVWRGQIPNICFQNTLLRVRPFKYDPDLLRYCLLYLALSGQFIANTKGVNIIHIGKAGLAKFVVPEPPESEQKDLLERLNIAFAHADRLEAEAARARELLDRLQSAILAKAFKGELVPQDPNDEPASLLLERIKAARSQQPQSQPKRSRKASVPRAPREKAVMTKSRQDEDVKNMPYLANIIRGAGGSSKVEDLFSKADLPVTDFYKQLAWEVDQGHIRNQDNQVLQAA
ncbi:restriction endonuclease subunit S [Bradyrhizobium sp. DASA03007]|uniref:restriction endonuclease subunit S n=1 Tax=unclassified Bradyrhizobium TaxID=2631580 RepID=UPI003F6FB75F